MFHIFTQSKKTKPPLNPVMNSYVTDILPVLRNPYGRESTYYVKISAVDLEGNISEPLEVNNINVDHYPPSVPDIFCSQQYTCF